MFTKISNLENLELKFEDNEDWGHVTQLIGNHKYFDTLIVSYYQRSLNKNPLPPRINFNLKVRHLIISDNFVKPDLYAFIAPFRGNVDNVTLVFSEARTSFQRILQVWDTVKALNFHAELPRDELFYLEAKVNPNLTELFLEHEVHVTGLIGIFKVFPNLKILSIFARDFTDDGVSQDDIECLHNHLKGLDCFRVTASYDDALAEKVLRNITHLEMFHNSTIDWMEWREACENLNSLVLERKKHVDLEKVSEAMPNLTALQLEFKVFELRHLDTITRKMTKLKTLHMEGATPAVVSALRNVGIQVALEKPILDDFHMPGAFEVDNRFLYFNVYS